MSTQPKAKSILSRRYIVSAAVGAAVGFFGQLAINLLCWYSHCSQAAATFVSEGLASHYLAKTIQPQYLSQARELWCQGVFLIWLDERGEEAVCATVLSALIFASSVYAVDGLEEKSAPKSQEPG